MKLEYIEENRVAGTNKEELSRLQEYLEVANKPAIKEAIGLNDQRAWNDRVDYILIDNTMIDTKTWRSGRKDILYLNLQKVYYRYNHIGQRKLIWRDNKADLLVIFQPERTIEIRIKDFYKVWKEYPTTDVGWGKEPWWQTVHQKNSKTQQVAFAFEDIKDFTTIYYRQPGGII